MVTASAPRKRTTQSDVARRAGVSQSIVSYVLNGSSRVSIPAATRQRVLAAIEELGYVPDGAARSLRTRRTFTVACVIPDITNPFYPAFERGIQDVAEQHGYDLLAYNTDGDESKERKCLELALRGRVDGLILTPYRLTAEDVRPLAGSGAALVLMGTMPGDLGAIPVDQLYVDNAAAARAAVVHLIDLGHRRIGMVAGEGGTPMREQRVAGYRRALRERGLPLDDVLVRGGGFTEAGGYTAARTLLSAQPDVTAVFAANDLMAIGALNAATDLGLRVPADLSIVGFDGIPAAALVKPPLTTIDQRPDRIGRRAAEALFERLAGTAPPGSRSEALPFELVVRGSSAPPRASPAGAA
jgi:LacI family transcriptional regulator